VKFVRRSLLVAVALPVVLSGCGEDPHKPPPYTPSPTPTTTSPSPTPTKAAWEQKTPAGAEAFAKHWIDVFNQATATGNAEEFRKLGTKDCPSCGDYADFLNTVYKQQGGHIEGGRWTVVKAVANPKMQGGQMLVTLRLQISPQHVFHNGHGKDEKFGGGPANYTARLVWSVSG